MSVNTSPLNAREFWIHIITAFTVAAPMSTSSRFPAAVVDRRRPRAHIPTTAATNRRPVPWLYRPTNDMSGAGDVIVANAAITRKPTAAIDARSRITAAASRATRPGPITTKTSAALGVQCVAYTCGVTTTRSSPAIATTAIGPHRDAFTSIAPSPTRTESSPCTRIPENVPLCSFRAGDRPTLGRAISQLGCQLGSIPTKHTSTDTERTSQNYVGRIKPSCMTVTTSSPSRVKIDPSAMPRAPEADWLRWWYSSHSSARNGRWNHMA